VVNDKFLVSILSAFTQVDSLHTTQNAWCFQSGCSCTTVSCSY